MDVSVYEAWSIYVDANDENVVITGINKDSVPTISDTGTTIYTLSSGSKQFVGAGTMKDAAGNSDLSPHYIQIAKAAGGSAATKVYFFGRGQTN